MATKTQAFTASQKARHIIFYFKATENSKCIAEKIAAKTGDLLICIADCIQDGRYAFEPAAGETIGYVVPVYFFGLPMVVVEFLEKWKVPAKYNCYSYAVLKCGGSTGDAERFFRRVFPVTAIFGIVMVDNYVTLSPVASNAEIKERLAKAALRIAEIAQQVKKNDAGRYDTFRGNLPGLFTTLAYPLYKHGRKTQKFSVGESCTSCGLCAKIFPRGVIRLADVKPVWTATQCELCLACLHRCPAAAIQYGKKSAGHGRYVNPETRFYSSGSPMGSQRMGTGWEMKAPSTLSCFHSPPFYSNSLSIKGFLPAVRFPVGHSLPRHK